MTGFHKRKVQKHEAAKKKAIEREKQERLDNRREVSIRFGLLHCHVFTYAVFEQETTTSSGKGSRERSRSREGLRRTSRGRYVHRSIRFAHVDQHLWADDSEDEWAGIGGSSKKGKERAEEKEEEYEDEEQLATVTVVEDFDPEALLHGPDIPRNVEEETSLSTLPPTTSRTQKTRSSQERNGGIPTAMKKIRGKASTKPKDIKYQTKSDRKSERSKQQKRRTEKAQLAGGKASRKKIGGRGKR